MRVLIFGTVYEDCQERADLTDLWRNLHNAINPDCELLLIDSSSPYRPSIAERHPSLWLYNFPNNIGHLARGGRDGWGRAFCTGLEIARAHGHDYAVHIEGDSLCRLPVLHLIEQLVKEKVKVAATEIFGGVETGFMIFSVDWLREANFVHKYDWLSHNSSSPLPEIAVGKILGNVLYRLHMRACRDDYGKLTPANVTDWDWITHTKPECYKAFAEAALVGSSATRCRQPRYGA